MEILKGIPVSPGVYIGEAFLLEGQEVRIAERIVPAEQIPAEVKRYEDASEKVSNELDSLRSVTESQLGANLASILSVQTQLLKDPSLRKRIVDRIQDKKYSADFAVAKTLRDLAKVMANSESQMIS